jgi:hypothetical protein
MPLKDAESVKIRNTQGFIDSENPLPVTGNLTTSAGSIYLSEFITQDLWEPTSKITYIGKVKVDSTWLFTKMDETTDLVIRYANLSNNPGVTSYTLASTNRAALTYELLEDLSF